MGDGSEFAGPSKWMQWLYMWGRIGRWYDTDCWVRELDTRGGGHLD